MSGLSLNANSVALGSTTQGTVTLTAAAPSGGTIISLSSSNPNVAAVPASVAIQAGSTTASFSVTAAAVGTATITASLTGGSRQSTTITVTAAVVLSTISLGASTVVGGNTVLGTAVLNGPAPSGGAVVTLSSGDPITVPPNVTVPDGSTSAPFTISTRAVGGTITGTITGSYGGASKSATLSVTRPTVATAAFGVTGTETDTCTMANGGNTLACTFNGSTSSAPGTIIAWDWSYGVATTFTQTTTSPVLTNPTVSCSLLPAPPLPAGTSWLPMTVKLKIRDNQGNVSAEAVNAGVRLFPQGVCGY